MNALTLGDQMNIGMAIGRNANRQWGLTANSPAPGFSKQTQNDCINHTRLLWFDRLDPFLSIPFVLIHPWKTPCEQRAADRVHAYRQYHPEIRVATSDK
jgi:hypothetical protein